jgi:hypothetical protein
LLPSVLLIQFSSDFCAGMEKIVPIYFFLFWVSDNSTRKKDLARNFD